MNTALPSKRDRWLALGLLAAVLLLIYLLFVHTAWTVPMREINTQIDSDRERESRARALLAQAPEIRRRLRELSAQDSGFLAEPTPELATAGLVRTLETVVAQASPGNRSCVITNRTPLMYGSQDIYERVTVMVRLRCGTPELAKVLFELENGIPVLFVNNFNVMVDPYSVRQGQDQEEGGAGLDVSFELYGYLRPAAAIVDAPEAAAEAPQDGGFPPPSDDEEAADAY